MDVLQPLCQLEGNGEQLLLGEGYPILLEPPASRLAHCMTYPRGMEHWQC